MWNLSNPELRLDVLSLLFSLFSPDELNLSCVFEVANGS
jgi:hypothetical protein